MRGELMRWKGMEPFRKEMERFFERFGEAWPWEGELFAAGEWAPRLDVSETKDALVVKAEVPGIEPKEIQVSIEDGLLTIKGEKKQEKEEKEEKYYRVERSYGSFARSVYLPTPVDEAKVSATFKNGLLTVTLPKTAKARGTMIPIKAD